jgi:hypothetical protein
MSQSFAAFADIRKLDTKGITIDKFDKICRTLVAPNGIMNGMWRFQCDSGSSVTDLPADKQMRFCQYLKKNTATDDYAIPEQYKSMFEEEKSVCVGILVFCALLKPLNSNKEGTTNEVVVIIQELELNSTLQSKFALGTNVLSSTTKDCNIEIYTDLDNNSAATANQQLKNRTFITISANDIQAELRMFPIALLDDQYLHDELKGSYVRSLVSVVPDSCAL